MDTIVTPVTVITLDSTRIVHSIKADLVARYFPPVVRLVQYDQSLPVIAVSLMQNGQAYTLPSGAAANIRVHKPDATYVYNPALGCDSTRKIVYFEVTQAMAAANGDGLAIIEIVVNGDIAGTSLITLHFEENPVPEDAIESSDEWETIYELGERIIASTVTPVSTAAGMTDHDVVYLYTGTESGWNQGHMYYYNGTTWVDAGIAVTDTTLSVAGLAADAKKTGDEIADLKDGLKEDGVAASAEQLLSDKYTVDQVPYHYRASGGNGADREYDEIVGGSVVWNQLANPGSYTEVGITGTTTNGVITINGTTTGAGYYSMGATFTISDHVYLIDRKQNTQLDGVTFYNDGKGILLNYNVDSSVQKANGAGRFYIRIASGVTFNNYQTTPQIFDLTAMFGSTIADYIYSLEQSSAGVGVALFRTLFPGVYAYDAGTMRHVSGLQSHDTVGFNAWDEEWEAGVYTVAGNKGGSASSNAIRCKEPIKVFPNAEYSIYLGDSGTQYRLHFLDESKNVISMINYRAVLKWTTPQNCHYILFCTLGDTAPVYGNTYKNDICINLSDPSRNGEYEPYVKHSYPLDSSLTLRGVPKLADGKIYYDGDTYAADGTVTRKYGIVDLGTLTWYYNTAEGYAKRFYTENIKSLVKYETNNTLPHAICKYNGMSANDLQNVSASKDRAFAINYVGNLYIRDDAYTDTATFKAAMSGVYLVYELATPTTETAEPFINPQKVDPYGTEEYVSTSLVPVGHYTKYPENLRAKLENLDLSMIAPIETGTTASQAYAVGKYFLLNNKFCKAKTAIASGATFTLGTNYEVTTVADELYTALNA